RSHQQHYQPTEQSHGCQRDKDAGAGNGVRASRKDLTHTTGLLNRSPACRAGTSSSQGASDTSTALVRKNARESIIDPKISEEGYGVHPWDPSPRRIM